MTPSDILSLIGKTNKVSIIFFVITCILLGYELFLYIKDKKHGKKPSIPTFKKGGKEPLTTHPAKPMPAPPDNPGNKPQAAVIPPLITQMSSPTMKHSPQGPGGPGPLGGKKKKKMSRGAKATIGATAALAVLTIGIAWRLNQPTSQQAGGLNSQNARASEQGGTIPGPLVSSPSSALNSNAAAGGGTGRSLIPTITPRPDVVDLSSNTTTNDFPSVTITPSSTGSATASESAGMDPADSSASSDIATLPLTGGGESTETAVIEPSLPAAGTIQYSLGLLVIASIIMISSLIL